MNYTLPFSVCHSFRSRSYGITIPICLRYQQTRAFADAKLDTGSEYCLFQREIADQLGIDVLTGDSVKLHTLTDQFTAYAHYLELNTFDIRFESIVLFVPAYGVQRNILGRQGWLNNLHLALAMDTETIYLKAIHTD